MRSPSMWQLPSNENRDIEGTEERYRRKNNAYWDSEQGRGRMVQEGKGTSKPSRIPRPTKRLKARAIDQQQASTKGSGTSHVMRENSPPVRVAKRVSARVESKHPVVRRDKHKGSNEKQAQPFKSNSPPVPALAKKLTKTNVTTHQAPSNVRRQASPPVPALARRQASPPIPALARRQASPPVPALARRQASPPVPALARRQASPPVPALARRQASPPVPALARRQASPPVPALARRQASPPVPALARRQASPPVPALARRQASPPVPALARRQASPPVPALARRQASPPVPALARRQASPPVPALARRQKPVQENSVPASNGVLRSLVQHTLPELPVSHSTSIVRPPSCEPIPAPLHEGSSAQQHSEVHFPVIANAVEADVGEQQQHLMWPPRVGRQRRILQELAILREVSGHIHCYNASSQSLHTHTQRLISTKLKDAEKTAQILNSHKT